MIFYIVMQKICMAHYSRKKAAVPETTADSQVKTMSFYTMFSSYLCWIYTPVPLAISAL